MNLEDLLRTQRWFQERGVETTVYDLNLLLPAGTVAEPAYFLHAKNGVSCFCDPDQLLAEQDALPWDTKFFSYGEVKNKIARHNLCFANFSQEPDYEQKMGRVIAFDQLPLLNQVKAGIEQAVGEKGRNLIAEGNYYYDVNKCYIGYHGDKERRKVFAIRLGAPFPFYYQWFHQWKPVGTRGTLMMTHGDFYIMSEKAVGTDWKYPSLITLRHAAGPEKKVEWKPKKK